MLDAAILLDELNIAMWKRRQKAGGERDMGIARSSASLRGTDEDVHPYVIVDCPEALCLKITMNSSDCALKPSWAGECDARDPSRSTGGAGDRTVHRG